MPSQLTDILAAFWAVLAEMAPWLIFGFLAAGVLSVWVKPAWIEKHLGGRGLWPVTKASALGVPLPLCSCGVIPVGTSLYQHGASKGSTASFLLSTPQTGVDSILATYALLGPVFAVVRPLVALINGIAGGYLIDRFADTPPEVAPEYPKHSATPAPSPNPSQREGGLENAAHTCACSGSPPEAAPANSCCSVSTPTPESSCCSAVNSNAPQTGLAQKISAALRYGLVTLPADLVGSLLIGLFLAAVLTSMVSESALAAWLGHPWFGLFAAVAVGTPIYVCSTGSIPIVVALLHLGASPGAALAFLIAGPATNAATIAVVGGVLGKRTMAFYLASVLVTALLAGYGLNLLAPHLPLRLPLSTQHLHEHAMTTRDHAWAAALMLLLAVGLFRRVGRKVSPCPTPTTTPATAPTT